MKAEPLLASLHALRKDFEDEPDCPEYLALHHAFCFISYKMADFQAYLDEMEKQGGATNEAG